MYRYFFACLLITAACAPVQYRAASTLLPDDEIEAGQYADQDDQIAESAPNGQAHFMRVSINRRSNVERQILASLNRQRIRAGLRPLTFSRQLASAAREHNAAMTERQVFAHRLSGETDLFERVRGSGLATDTVGENLFATEDQEPGRVAQTCVAAWMRSPGHRQNMLSTAFARTGIAVDRGSDGMQYITVDFAH